jgi:hypothetical protein
VDKSPWPDDKEKIGTKIMHLGMWCVVYMSDNDDNFPDELADIVRAGITTEKVLKKVLASPDDPDGPPVIQYRKPDKDAEWSTEVMLYEIYDQWPKDGVVVCFTDSHAEIITDKNRFEELIK